MENKRITIMISKETLEDMKQTCYKIRKQNIGNMDIAKMLAWLSTIIFKAEEG